MFSTNTDPTSNPYASLLNFTDKHTVELGACCSVAARGLHDVVLTDIDLVMPALKRNKPVLKKTLKTAQPYWTKPNQIEALNPPFNLVIATDVIYIEETVGPLVSAMEALVGDRGAVLLRYQIRSPEAHRLFWEICGGVFDVEKVPWEHLHPEYVYEEADVFVFFERHEEADVNVLRKKKLL
ncbi:hypothetical protein RHGRI_010161 [Rhododendron griersonianum]|uniref:S-adenosyl-L-methionine-dependent methyltransferase n=1 Tax=Rhododendron griersonianum TaxID=479676 RepID=A0AAV6KHH0_9ERIC|nr:hypothetical protein RHGRI_010161 [Rhododendron griersonianum]